MVAVFIIQAAFNAYQDWSSSRVMHSITALLPESCHLIRDGAQTEVSATVIVPGDILLLKAGNKIPADVRYLQTSHDMTVDRAVLTGECSLCHLLGRWRTFTDHRGLRLGESKPIKSTTESADDNYLETRCIGLQGTYCVFGSATGIVLATGDSTIFGQIAKLAGEPKTTLTTIEKDILRFVLLIFAIMVTWIVILASVWYVNVLFRLTRLKLADDVLLLGGGWLRKDHPDWISVSALIVSCVSVAIAYIPEGLPIAVTSSLTITANLMKNKILCKSLKTVETLGSVSVICSDKTGTLTRVRRAKSYPFPTEWLRHAD